VRRPTAVVAALLTAACAAVALAQGGAGFAAPTAVIAPPPGGAITAGGVPDEVRQRHAFEQTQVLARVAALARGIEPLGEGFIRPVAGPVSSPFGWRNVSVAGNRFHGGADFVARTGTPVMAARGGRVIFAGWGGAYGYAVYVDHETGWQTRYAHLSRIDVTVGDLLRQGAVLGAVGSTGASTNAHLHFEVRFEGRALDPLQFVPR
jgi:murein DD-endopeptidase MepM/ murein hydrolase activator NlpD